MLGLQNNNIGGANVGKDSSPIGNTSYIYYIVVDMCKTG